MPAILSQKAIIILLKAKHLILLLLFISLSLVLYRFYGRVLGTNSSKQSWTLIATGDVMLGRTVNTQSQKKNDFTWAFKEIAPLLSSADLTLINLESPLIKDCPLTDKGMVFCGSTNHLQGLKLAGIDLANLANNHIYNHGQSGLKETVSFLNQNSISPVGLGYVATRKIGDQKIAFLGFETLGKYNLEDIKLAIKSSKTTHDSVIVSFHWGTEYMAKPNSTQVSIAHAAIDAGADLIIGHHPHWVQTEEEYQGKKIFYSLGNLIFDQMWSKETRQGLVVRLRFQGNKLTNIERFPITIFDYGQPRLQP